MLCEILLEMLNNGLECEGFHDEWSRHIKAIKNRI